LVQTGRMPDSLDRDLSDNCSYKSASTDDRVIEKPGSATRLNTDHTNKRRGIRTLEI
jgi:hypothetical protein